MSEKIFESSLSMGKIENSFKDISFFDGVMEGLEEALAYEKGTAKPETVARKHSLPDVNVSQIRNALSMTQKAFANVLGVSCRTVEAWGSGRSNPTPTAKKLMFLISQDHSLIQKL